MSECLFCKIIAGTIPSVKLFEDEDVFVFLDINPVNYGHTLVVPKVHSTNMYDADDQVLAKLAVISARMGRAISKALGVPGFNLEANNGEVAGQIIPHTHWHVIPRLSDDGLRHWPGKKYDDGQAQVIADKIISNI